MDRTCRTLAPPRTEMLAPFDIQWPEVTTIPASDGFKLPARILRPANFRADRKYPVIMNVYGGASLPIVSDSWGSDTLFYQLLLAEGYVVVKVDNRSATGISKTLENSVVGRLGAGETADLVDAAKWLKAQSWVDPDRVGVWGWSNGGYITLTLMTRSDAFKAGIAVAPVTDWRFYDSRWAEAFLGHAAGESEGVRRRLADPASGRAAWPAADGVRLVRRQRAPAKRAGVHRRAHQGRQAVRPPRLPDAQARHRRPRRQPAPVPVNAGVLEEESLAPEALMFKTPRTVRVCTLVVGVCGVLATLPRAPVHADQASKSQSVLVTVLDQDGMPIRDLKPLEFLVREDNQSREVTGAEISTEPLFVVCLADTTKPPLGITPPTQDLRAALATFVKTVTSESEGTEIALMEYRRRRDDDRQLLAFDR